MAKRSPPAVEVAGVIKIASQHGGPQMMSGKGKRTGFDRAKRQHFVDALALTCNVTISADFAGVTMETVYKHRRHDPVFAGQWREALEMGMERLEMLVVEHGGAGLPLAAADPERALAEGIAAPAFDFDKALRALQYHAKTRAGIARRSNQPQPRAEETDAAITTLLARLKTRALSAERSPLAALPAPDGGVPETEMDRA